MVCVVLGGVERGTPGEAGPRLPGEETRAKVGEEKRSRTDPRTAILQGDPPLGPPPLCSRNLDKLQSRGLQTSLELSATASSSFGISSLGWPQLRLSPFPLEKTNFGSSIL